MPKFPVGAPRQRVLKAFQRLGFELAIANLSFHVPRVQLEYDRLGLTRLESD